MAAIVIEVIGAQQVEDILRQVGVRAAPVIQAATESAANIIRNEAKALVPARTGTLRRSITTRKAPGAYSNLVSGYIVGPQEPYGLYVEFGTGIHAEGGNGRQTPWRYQRGDGSWVTTQGSRPKPFLRPAYANKRAEALKEITDAITALVQGGTP